MGTLLSNRDAGRVGRVLTAFETNSPGEKTERPRDPRNVGGGDVSLAIELAVTNVDIVADGSGLVTIWDDDVSPPVATAATETAVLDWLHGGDEVKSGKQVVIVKFGSIWRILWAECDEEPTLTRQATLPDPDARTFPWIIWDHPTDSAQSGIYVLDTGTPNTWRKLL